MAIVTNFGMMFSLFVTLIFIPVLYTFVDDYRVRSAARRLGKEAAKKEKTGAGRIGRLPASLKRAK